MTHHPDLVGIEDAAGAAVRRDHATRLGAFF
jgi:hypothetical protein